MEFPAGWRWSSARWYIQDRTERIPIRWVADVMQFSNDVMEAMGFREFVEAGAITAAFSSITVYEARGIAVAIGITEISKGIVAGVEYRLAVGASVNDACHALVADEFVDDEDKWKKENSTQGPFVLVLLGPTQEHHCSSGRINNNEAGSVITYECFPGVRAELAQLESKALAPIVAGLTCVLNEDGRYVALRKLTRSSAGRTTSGQVVHDIWLEFRMEMSTSYNLTNSQLTEKLVQAKNLTETLNPNASRLFALGLAEGDQLKRFLFFFLSLEVQTQAAFGQIDHAAALAKILDGSANRLQSATSLLVAQVENLKDLKDKFIWCANCVWVTIGDADIAQFKALKAARDKIAHSSAAEPPLGFARKAELLAHKVLWIAK